jgi:hypothetical protein
MEFGGFGLRLAQKKSMRTYLKNKVKQKGQEV